ncbi:uncharacterized protein LOC127654742 isoform X2 [Xyrauchen texanus]|nr:uncharacterized protein LOC127654742 isoform X2 [Xyrauchen texanus]
MQICESNIEQKKDYINTTQKTIRTLDEEIQAKQNTVKFIKENAKNLQHTGDLLLQYEKTLETELEKRQDSYNEDMKMFQERIDGYMNVFQQYKDRYCLNSLAQKLLKIQAENEEIEGRIRVTEGQIMEKERELTGAMGEDDPLSLIDGAESSYRNSTCRDNEAQQTDRNESYEEVDRHQVPRIQRPEENADDHNIIEELSLSEENKTKTANTKDLSESQSDTFHHGLWTKPENGGDQMHDADQNEAVNELQEGTMNVSCDSEFMVEMIEEKDGDDLEKTRAGAVEDTISDGAICPPFSPARMKAVLTTPTFSLNNSPISSPGRQESSETKSPAFVFSVNSAPSTHVFPRLGCDFDVRSRGRGEPHKLVKSLMHFQDCLNQRV